MSVSGENQCSAAFCDFQPAGQTGFSTGEYQKAVSTERMWRFVRNSCQPGKRQHGDLVISHGRFPTVIVWQVGSGVLCERSQPVSVNKFCCQFEVTSHERKLFEDHHA